MATATKTIRQQIGYRPGISEWFESTQELYNRLVAFYFETIQVHQDVLGLSNQKALTALERLTHTTKRNPHPEMPLSQIAGNIPAMFRRAAINTALGSARSFFSNLKHWRQQKAKLEAKGRCFKRRPPVPPRNWNHTVKFYAGLRKERSNGRITLKLWDGHSWRWVRFRLSGRNVAAGWEAGSPQVVRKNRRWRLHTPISTTFRKPDKIKEQFRKNPALRVCAVDLNINDALAVCTIQTADGTVLATRFIRGGRELHGRRKLLLGRIARNRRRTSIIAEGEQDNADLWAKIRHLDENAAHRVSRRIVQFAQRHGAPVIVFEHLGSFRPQRGKYSRRANAKRSYWLRGRIFRYSKYKAWEAGGIITSRVSPRNTSRLCAGIDCGLPVARYGVGESLAHARPRQRPLVQHSRSIGAGIEYHPGAPLFWCPHCGRRGNADHNASLNIGHRFFARLNSNSSHYSTKPALKGVGVSLPQDAQGQTIGCAPVFAPAGLGSETGTAPPVLVSDVQVAAQAGLDTVHERIAPVRGIPRPLRPQRGSGYAAHTPERRLRRGAQRSPDL